MILTDLDRSILVAIAAGSIGGSFKSVLEDILRIKLDEEAVRLTRIISKCFFSAFTYGIILGIGIFIASLDSNITITQLNHLTIAFAILLIIDPLYYRAVSFIVFLFKKSKTN